MGMTPGAMIAFVQLEIGWHDHDALPIFGLTADKPAAAVAGPPFGGFLAMVFRWPRRSVGPGLRGTDLRQKCGGIFKDMEISGIN